MAIGTVKAPNADAERLEKLIARWRDLAEVGHPRERKNQVGWAEHVKSLAAEPEKRDSESKDDPALGTRLPRHENPERQLTQGSLEPEGLASFLEFLSQRR